MDTETYLSDLPPDATLRVFDGVRRVFSSSGRWLHPIFELEKGLAGLPVPPGGWQAHDTAVGKAAAVLMLRLGVRKIHANLASRLAVRYVASFGDGAELVADRLVDRLLCATESQLEPLSDADTMYTLLRQRAKLVLGVEVAVENLRHPHLRTDGLSLRLAPGDHIMVCGENGTGKTTFLRVLAGLERPAGGSVLVDGRDVSGLPPWTVGYIPQSQDGALFDLSVEEVVGLGVPESGAARAEAVAKALERVSAAHLAGRGFSTLSGGEKQKVSLARCLAQKARLLLLDEPTAALDAENRRMVVDVLLSLTVSEIPTLVVVTHDPRLATLRGWRRLDLGPNPAGAVLHG